MGLSAVRPGRVCDAVMAQIEALITSGEWPVGSKIPPEPELMAVLGVGRNSVREAVRALERAGLVEPRRGDGTYVRATSVVGAALLRRAPGTAARHVIAVRSSLERGAAAAAAMHRTDADILAIQEAIADCRAACTRDNHTTLAAADRAFRRAVIVATGNPVLIDLYAGLTQMLYGSVIEIGEMDDFAVAFASRDRLAVAIMAGDAAAATAAAGGCLDAAAEIIERNR